MQQVLLDSSGSDFKDAGLSSFDATARLFAGGAMPFEEFLLLLAARVKGADEIVESPDCVVLDKVESKSRTVLPSNGGISSLLQLLPVFLIFRGAGFRSSSLESAAPSSLEEIVIDLVVDRTNGEKRVLLVWYVNTLDKGRGPCDAEIKDRIC
mmetsp:Transcript_2232/g.3316  ORF Transcript_2232/g.3316 Transcript_2232/m.3316 type:complete len:153 (-) Transcript_2232:144-602(-)